MRGQSFVLSILYLPLNFESLWSNLSLKLGQSERKWLTSSTLFLQNRQSSPSVFVGQGKPPFSPKFPMSLICTCWRRLTTRYDGQNHNIRSKTSRYIFSEDYMQLEFASVVRIKSNISFQI